MSKNGYVPERSSSHRNHTTPAPKTIPAAALRTTPVGILATFINDVTTLAELDTVIVTVAVCWAGEVFAAVEFTERSSQ